MTTPHTSANSGSTLTPLLRSGLLANPSPIKISFPRVTSQDPCLVPAFGFRYVGPRLLQPQGNGLVRMIGNQGF